MSSSTPLSLKASAGSLRTKSLHTKSLHSEIVEPRAVNVSRRDSSRALSCIVMMTCVVAFTPEIISMLGLSQGHLSYAQPDAKDSASTYTTQTSLPATMSPSAILEASAPSAIPSQHRGLIDRHAIDEVVKGGVPRLLAQARITPARYKGRFIGFTLAQLVPQALALRAGFREGDIIMSVNGEPIGRPDQMMHALSLLPFAPTLIIRFKRSGVIREWTWKITP